MTKSVQKLNNTMAEYDDHHEDDDFWQAYTQAGLHTNLAATGFIYPPITQAPSQPLVERSLSPITPGNHGPFASYGSPVPFHSSEYSAVPSTAQDFQAPYSTSGCSRSSEYLEDPFAAQNPQTQARSPANASESSLSTTSYTGGPSTRCSPTTVRIAPKESPQPGKYCLLTIRWLSTLTQTTDTRISIDSIQTVEEARKSRRRAQNRTAQQAFKKRRKKREKELVKEVEEAEEHFKALQEEKKELEEELERKKQERSSSMVRLSGSRGFGRGSQGQSGSSSH